MDKLAVFTRYDSLGASSRLRFQIYREALVSAGFDVEYHHFFDNTYLKQLYSGGGKSRSALLKAMYRRIRELAAMPEEVPFFIEYELLPFLPWCVEKRFLKSRRYVLGFDDAVHLRYEKIPFLRSKYPTLLSNAAGIICANDLLASEFARFNSNIIKVPTVPPPEVPGSTPEKFDRFTVAWIGTPVTYEYLLQHAEHLKEMQKVRDFELLVIASEQLTPIPGVNMRCVNWDANSEMSLLRRSHIGIMPLPDTPFAKGKSAYKLIQYLRAGIPAIASPVGENTRVICHGETGFTATTPEEYREFFRLLCQKEIYCKMCDAIPEVAARYSFEKCAGELSTFLRRSFG